MRTLRKDSRVYSFAWNSVSKEDWQKIEKVFVDAFTDSYIDVPVRNINTHAEMSRYMRDYFIEEYDKIMAQGPDNKRIHYLVAYFEDQPVAFFTAEHNWKTGHAYLRLATVSPHFYRQGIGKFAIDEICRYFDTQGRIELIARSQNHTAVNFYRACGFNETNEFDFNEPSATVGFKAMVSNYFQRPNVMRPPADDEPADPSQFTGFRI